MARPKRGQAQFRNQYDRDCPYYCCQADERRKVASNIFFWLQAFLNHSSSSQFKAPQRAVLLAVYSFWHPKRPVCTATQHTIARRAGCQRSTVQRTLALAVEQGWLTETKNAGRKSNEYSPTVPSTFYSARSTPIGSNVSDEEQLSKEEMQKEAAKLSQRLKKANEAKLNERRIRPLPEGKHLSDLDVTEIFGIRGKALTHEEIADHALNDPKLSALIASSLPEHPSTQLIVGLVHDELNDNDESLYVPEGDETLFVSDGDRDDELGKEVSKPTRRVIKRRARV